jgi:hypothetical protein
MKEMHKGIYDIYKYFSSNLVRLRVVYLFFKNLSRRFIGPYVLDFPLQLDEHHL